MILTRLDDNFCLIPLYKVHLFIYFIFPGMLIGMFTSLIYQWQWVILSTVHIYGKKWFFPVCFHSLKAQENYLLIFWQWHSFHHYMGPSYFCLAICFNFLGVNASACDRIDFVKNRALSFSCTSYILITLRIIKLKIQLCSFTCSR